VIVAVPATPAAIVASDPTWVERSFAETIPQAGPASFESYDSFVVIPRPHSTVQAAAVVKEDACTPSTTDPLAI
jgi:microcompartment protein CcmL/EutN